MTKLTGKLRQAAILIASLDQRSADALLDQMAPEQAARVRSALMELEEIDAGEQRAVVGEFLRKRQGSGDRDDGVELDPELQKKLTASSAAATTGAERFGKVATTHATAPPAPAAAVEAGASFQFLQHTSPRDLALVLQREHPQVMAVVLAHLSPSFAAQVLPHFPADLQTEVLGRVADLESADAEVLRELERQLQSELQYTRPGNAQVKPGLGTVQAILEAVESAQRGELLGRLATADESLAKQLAAAPPFVGGPVVTALPRIDALEDGAFAASDSIEREPGPAQTLDAGAELPHEHAFVPLQIGEVLALSDRDLARLFRAAEPQVLLLALAGAPPSFVERILRLLPAREAKRLQKRLNRIGPLLLSDVEDAQYQLTQLATQLAEQGLVALPPERGFLAAA